MVDLAALEGRRVRAYTIVYTDEMLAANPDLDYEDDEEPEERVGILEHVHVESLDYWRWEVDGWTIDPTTVEPLDDDDDDLDDGPEESPRRRAGGEGPEGRA
jgi:hypothetical protein